MADKSSQLVLNALSRAAAEPHGLPLHAGKSGSGLFPSTPAGKQTALRTVEDGYLHRSQSAGPVRQDLMAKLPPELYTITDSGLEFLVEQSNPRTVLEDLVRVLEARSSQTSELLNVAGQMRSEIVHLSALAERVLHAVPRTESLTASLQVASAAHGERMAQAAPTERQFDERGKTGPSVTAAQVAAVHRAVLAELGRWYESGASEDFPLPELFRRLQANIPGLTIGRFHDALRDLHDADRIYLHPWTGPLYDLAEPAFALLAGHLVAYYASTRQHTEATAEEAEGHLLRFPVR